jgi:hypothetical protein
LTNFLSSAGKNMKSTALGVLVGLAVTALAAIGGGSRNDAFAQRGPDLSGELITVSTMIGERGQVQQLTVIDPRSRVMSVYHVESNSGAIALKSVRNINWDLMLSEFNGVSPLPREIRGMVETR